MLSYAQHPEAGRQVRQRQGAHWRGEQYPLQLIPSIACEMRGTSIDSLVESPDAKVRLGGWVIEDDERD